MFRNFTPSLRPLVAVCSAFVLLASMLGLYLATGDFTISLLFGLSVAIVSYIILIFLLRNYLHRRISLMYKFILSGKDSVPNFRKEGQNIHKKTLEEVESDVAQWSKNKNEELKSLQENIDFRKEFLQNLSHELKTPIFSIQGYIETLQEGAIDDKNVAIRFLNSASKGVERLVSLTESIDSIAKLESKKMVLQKSSFTPYTLIQDVFNELSLEAEKKNLSLELPKKTTEKIQTEADQAQIRQVLINLVHNAIKYCNSGNTIRAEIHKVDSSTLLVEIADNGPGIDEEHVSRVFERFYRTDSSRSRNIGGTGLGLAICKHIIEAHEQTITCRSKIDEGTTFGFTLPRI